MQPVDHCGLTYRRSWLAALLTLCAIAAAPRAAVAAGDDALTTAQTLLTIEPTTAQPRNSEGDIIELSSRTLALVYTRFTGGSSDHSSADLAIRTSDDNGATWTPDRVLLRNEGGCNVMSVSLLRATNGEILLFYLRKDTSAGS